MFELILVPVTDDVYSPHSVAHAQNLSRLLGSKLILLHVICDSGPTHGEAQALLERLALGSRFVPNLKLTECGDISIAEHILEVAHENADLIVIGTHGCEGTERLMLGSVAQAVAGSARIPVQIIPCHERSSNRLLDRWRRGDARSDIAGFILEYFRLEFEAVSFCQSDPRFKQFLSLCQHHTGGRELGLQREHRMHLEHVNHRYSGGKLFCNLEPQLGGMVTEGL
jgi:nucleotide-binding universal stress UspA family protein